MQTNLGETICKYRQIQNMTQEEFEENDSEIETAARDCIATDVIEILNWFEIDIDVEDALGERDW